MIFSEASSGRIFVIRLEHGEILHKTIETFAKENDISAATLTVLGGADSGSKLICGADYSENGSLSPFTQMLDNINDIMGVGTLFPDAEGTPKLHMHISCGYNKSSITGCVREGVKVWQIMEIVLFELKHCSAKRLKDEATGFDFLAP